jgi:hypothetical protein
MALYLTNHVSYKHCHNYYRPTFAWLDNFTNCLPFRTYLPMDEQNAMKFPTKEQWLSAWESAHSVYASDPDPSENHLCRALLWQANRVCWGEVLK